MASLSGRRAVVAGASGRYGPAVVRRLAATGAEVIAADRNVDGIRDLPSGVRALPCDMSEDAVTDAVSALEGEGRPIDIVVTCPPVLTAVEAPTAADLRTAFALAVEPVLSWTTAATNVMAARRGGAIVHVTGLSGLGGWRGAASAGAAFAAIHNLVQNFALAFAASEVRVNALVPGVDAGEARAIAATAGRAEQEIVSRIPLGLTMPEAALTDALLYLAHPGSTYVSGQVLAVDGGWSTWGRLHAVAS
ncbi:MAG TPA: SDR family oxidoreductase [Bauldia sp.]|nr:SDR family oxidoreductase [Bauldia sp.]